MTQHHIQNDTLLRGRWIAGAAIAVVLCMLLAPALANTVDVRIQGVDDPLMDNVRKSLSVAADHKEDWSAAQVKRLYRLAPKEIMAALAPYGYYNPEIKNTLEKAPDSKNDWIADFNIKRGPATRVKRLNLAAEGPGDELPEIREALRASELAEGERLIQSQYKSTKSALQTAAVQAGYLDAHFSQAAIRVRPKDNTAAIDLVLDTGERYYFGGVTFDQTVLNDDLAQRFVPFDRGQPFDTERLIDLQLALSETDYFNQIAITAPRDAADREAPINDWLYDMLYPPDDPLISIGRLEVPVTVKAEASKPQSYKISGGYGTDTGPRVGFGVKFRHLNKRGHQFSTDVRISQIQQALHASYDIPIENVVEDKLSFTAEASNEEFGDISSFKYGIGAVRDTGWSLGRKRAYIKLERETYDLEDGFGNRTSTLLYPGYTITLKKADDLLNTRKGIGLSLDVHGGSSALASSTDFIQAKATGKVVLPLTSRSRLLLRSEFGATSVNDFDKLPPSQRFFTGGDRTVRGYGYQTISATNDDNDDIGGRYLAVGSVETDYRVYGPFGVAAFFDIGDVANTTNFDFKRGVGIGFRYNSPVGKIRLDLAHPLDDPDSSFRIHFSLGPDL